MRERAIPKVVVDRLISKDTERILVVREKVRPRKGSKRQSKRPFPYYMGTKVFKKYTSV